jgi:hypothetical protein
MKTQRSFGYALIGLLSVFAALQGCSDDENSNDKPPTVTPTAGKTGSGGSDGENGGAGNNTSTAGKTGKAGNASTGGKTAQGGETSTPVGGVGGEGGDGQYVPDCNLPELGEDGCFNCPKNGQTEQWLNRCVDSECEPFDNGRLPLLKADGTLPPLP